MQSNTGKIYQAEPLTQRMNSENQWRHDDFYQLHHVVYKLGDTYGQFQPFTQKL